MAILYIDNPHMRENGTTIIQMGLEQSDDADMWVSLTHVDLNDDDVYRHSNGRVRMQGGGSSSTHMHEALVTLMRATDKDVTVCGELGNKPSAPITKALQPRPYEERHLDDRNGYIGIEILENGDVRLHMRPLEEPLALNDGCTPIDVIIPHTTPFQHAYRVLGTLWQGIHLDNIHKKPIVYA